MTNIDELYSVKAEGVHQHKQHPELESVLVLIWLGLVLGVSFLESFPRTNPAAGAYRALDVERHVFAALNIAEGFLAAALWGEKFTADRLLAPWHSSLLQVLATSVLFLEVLVVSPRLFLRAKHCIVKGLENNNHLTAEESEKLRALSAEVKARSMPSCKWHSIYAAMELSKVIFLDLSVFLMWFE